MAPRHHHRQRTAAHASPPVRRPTRRLPARRSRPVPARRSSAHRARCPTPERALPHSIRAAARSPVGPPPALPGSARSTSPSGKGGRRAGRVHWVSPPYAHQRVERLATGDFLGLASQIQPGLRRGPDRVAFSSSLILPAACRPPASACTPPPPRRRACAAFPSGGGYAASRSRRRGWRPPVRQPGDALPRRPRTPPWPSAARAGRRANRVRSWCTSNSTAVRCSCADRAEPPSTGIVEPAAFGVRRGRYPARRPASPPWRREPGRSARLVPRSIRRPANPPPRTHGLQQGHISASAGPSTGRLTDPVAQPVRRNTDSNKRA